MPKNNSAARRAERRRDAERRWGVSDHTTIGRRASYSVRDLDTQVYYYTVEGVPSRRTTGEIMYNKQYRPAR